jgi:hypothetical protein
VKTPLQHRSAVLRKPHLGRFTDKNPLGFLRIFRVTVPAAAISRHCAPSCGIYPTSPVPCRLAPAHDSGRVCRHYREDLYSDEGFACYTFNLAAGRQLTVRAWLNPAWLVVFMTLVHARVTLDHS